MGSLRPAGAFQTAWLVRGKVSRNALPAARRSSREETRTLEAP